MTETTDTFSDPRKNEAVWRALDLARAYAARDRAAIVEPHEGPCDPGWWITGPCPPRRR